MRAEEFADKYNINTSAVRYYAEKAMFTPKGENAQYIVDEACIVQMGRIMQYKKYDFTLEEIEELFYCEGASWMYQKIIVPEACWDVIMAGPFSCNFLLKKSEKLARKCSVHHYRLSIKKIEKMQKYFSDTNRKIIFIAGCAHHIPIRKGCVDLYIGGFSGNNYTFTYNEIFFLRSASTQEDAKVAGIFMDYAMVPRNLENFKKGHEGFSPEAMKTTGTYENFTSGKIRITDQINFGSSRK